MTPLPAPLGGSEVIAWRLDPAARAATWDSGEGAFINGGRWNSPGTRVVYCSFDPSTALIEVAVHLGFTALSRVPHVLTSARIADPHAVHVVTPDATPIGAAAQQVFGDRLLSHYPILAIPSVVSPQSWNVLLAIPAATGLYVQVSQEPLVIDPRLHRL